MTKHISPHVKIDLLYLEGVRWAGWYRPANLDRKYAEVFGACLRGSFGPRWVRWAK